MSNKAEIQIKDIAAEHGYHPKSMYRLSLRDNAFPKPVRVIGPTKLYDARAVKRFFANRPRGRK